MGSSPAQTFISWVRILLKAWTSVYTLCVCVCVCACVLSCLGRSLATGSSPVQGVLTTVCKIHNFIINSEREQVREPNPSSKRKRKKCFLCLGDLWVLCHEQSVAAPQLFKDWRNLIPWSRVLGKLIFVHLANKCGPSYWTRRISTCATIGVYPEPAEFSLHPDISQIHFDK
jgi:hypothetical protein